MQFSVPHKTTKEAAKDRINDLLSKHQKEIAEQAQDVQAKWRGDTLDFAFTAQGVSLSGTVTVTDAEYELYAKLPLKYRLFEGTIERMIKAEVAKLGQ